MKKESLTKSLFLAFLIMCGVTGGFMSPNIGGLLLFVSGTFLGFIFFYERGSIHRVALAYSNSREEEIISTIIFGYQNNGNPPLWRKGRVFSTVLPFSSQLSDQELKTVINRWIDGSVFSIEEISSQYELYIQTSLQKNHVELQQETNCRSRLIEIINHISNHNQRPNPISVSKLPENLQIRILQKDIRTQLINPEDLP